MVSQNNRIVSQNNRIVSRNNRIVSQNNRIVSRNNRIVIGCTANYISKSGILFFKNDSGLLYIFISSNKVL
ncbi:hypothetical protein [Nostoc sp.]|uniref:hypothetical protein n=1 Tax=Nostoc sp. TaxID=1180 RepID=UPI003FA53140